MQVIALTHKNYHCIILNIIFFTTIFIIATIAIIAIIAIMVNIDDTFQSMPKARKAIRQYIILEGESYAPNPKSDNKRFIITYHDHNCKFCIQASNTAKLKVRITIKLPHTYGLLTYYKFRPSYSIWYLKQHHRASVINNRNITPTQIQSNKRLRFYNDISYCQAHRVKQALLVEIKGSKQDCFAKFPAYIHRLQEADPRTYSKLSLSLNLEFKAYAITPSACISASRRLRPFFALDACHTKSQFPIILIIFVNINACENVVLLS
jgi:hypothetical protein